MNLNIQIELLYASAFALLLALYGTLSSTTPDSIGMAELTIGALLLLLGGIPAIVSVITIGSWQTGTVRLPKTFFVSLLYLLTIPTLVAVVRNISLQEMIRDIIPLLYLFLPIFIVARIRNHEIWMKVTVLGLVFVGTAFSIRHFRGAEHELLEIGTKNFADVVLFPQDAAVHFSLFFLALASIYCLATRRLLSFVVVGLTLVAPLLAVSSIFARGPLGILLASIVLFSISLGFRTGIIITIGAFSSILIVGVQLFADATLQNMILSTADKIILKHQERGNTGRILELEGIWGVVTESPQVLLFGLGWGAEWTNPVHGRSVSYVHNLLGHILLKSGLVGLVAVIIYGTTVVMKVLRIEYNRETLLILIPTVGAIFINAFFEVSYKGLTFGVLLLAVWLLILRDSESKVFDATSR